MKKLFVGTLFSLLLNTSVTGVNAQISESDICNNMLLLELQDCITVYLNCRKKLTDGSREENKKLYLSTSVCKYNYYNYTLNTDDSYIFWLPRTNSENYENNSKIHFDSSDEYNNKLVQINLEVKDKLERPNNLIQVVRPVNETLMFNNNIDINTKLNNPTGFRNFSNQIPNNIEDRLNIEINKISNQNEILSPNFTKDYNHINTNFGVNTTPFPTHNFDYGGYNLVQPSTNFNQNQISIPQNMNTNLQNLINR